MKNSSKNKLTLTVGITTCYGDDSILDTVKSIRASKGIDKFRFIIVADRVPIKPKLKKALKKYGVELIENKIPAGQCPKKKQIIALTQSDVILFTQDDVLFEPKALATIMSRFEKHPDTQFISIRKQPVPATNFFEDITQVGTRVINRIAKMWNSGDNYLSVIGRCMAIRTNWVKQFNIPDQVASSDAYFYFENKRLRGTFEYLSQVALFYKKPQTLTEHLRKSSRFRHQRLEMSQYFGDSSKHYKIPKNIYLRAVISEWIDNPLKTTFYFAIYLYTLLLKSDPKQALTANWEVDISTKKVI